MPPVRTLKKTSSKVDLASYGFCKVPKAEAIAAAAKVVLAPQSIPPAHLSTNAVGVTAPTIEPVPHEGPGSPLATADAGASSAPLKPKPRLPKPVVKGVKDPLFMDSRDDWDRKYYKIIGTSTRKITLGCSFKLTDQHIDDIVFMGPKVCVVLTEFKFNYTDVDYESHNDAYGLTDWGVQRLADNCPNLKKISLPGTSGLTDNSLLRLVGQCPGLTHLEITGAHITEDGWAEFQLHPEWAPKLQKLRLEDESGDKAFMRGMREFSKARPDLPIELVSTSQFKKDGWWQMNVDHTTYKKGRKQSYNYG